MTTYIVYRNGSIGTRPKTFTKKTAAGMTSTWKRFNDYAKENGFSEETLGSQYLGQLAWQNPRTGEIMELRKATEEDLRYIAAPTPSIFTTDYQMSYGRMPRGRGSWAFFLGSRDDMATVFFTPSMIYADAKRLALLEGKRRGVTFIHVGT
jgi:hypothetical protein